MPVTHTTQQPHTHHSPILHNSCTGQLNARRPYFTTTAPNDFLGAQWASMDPLRCRERPLGAPRNTLGALIGPFIWTQTGPFRSPNGLLNSENRGKNHFSARNDRKSFFYSLLFVEVVLCQFIMSPVGLGGQVKNKKPFEQQIRCKKSRPFVTRRFFAENYYLEFV